jgi:HNH endonuclease
MVESTAGKALDSEANEPPMIRRAISSAVERSLDMGKATGSTPVSPTNTWRSFWDHVILGDDKECWPWTGGRGGSMGYGRFRGRQAHRVAYEISRGPIPDGMVVRHSCDNPLCCNPFHLNPGTHKDNTGDAIKRGRLATGARHGKTKLTQEIVDYIRANPLNVANCDLAILYGVSEASICRIRKGNRWNR